MKNLIVDVFKCKNSIRSIKMSMDISRDEFFIQKTFALANSSVDHGNQPFGSVIAKNDNNDNDKLENNIVCEAENTELTEDPTCHAEMNAIRKLYKKKLSKEEHANMTLYSSTEFCSMCISAGIRAGIKRMVFSCPAPTMSEIAKGGSLPIRCHEIAERYTKGPIDIVGQVLEDEGAEIHKKYWPSKLKLKEM